jgi:hypothetical protein
MLHNRIIISLLDKIANSLEFKGFIKEAYYLDVISNTVDVVNSKINQIYSNLSLKYPKAKGLVSGLKVRSKIPNMGSISSSLENYVELDSIREIPLSEFDLTGRSYSLQETDRIQSLAREIKQNKEINPLIVVADNEGLYILEGGHRAEALFLLGVKTLPALVIIDLDEFNS